MCGSDKPPLTEEQIQEFARQMAESFANAVRVNPGLADVVQNIALNPRTSDVVAQKYAIDTSRFGGAVKAISTMLGIPSQEFSIKRKSGAESGFLLSSKDGNHQFVVKFKTVGGLSSERENAKHCINLMMYKVIELIGFGPNVHILPLPLDKTLALASEHLDRIKEKEGLTKSYSFNPIGADGHQLSPDQNSAYDLLVSTLQINDLHGDNHGIVKSEIKKDGEVLVKEKYKIVDFDKSEIDRASFFAVRTNQKKETEDMLARLVKGHKGHPSLLEALEKAKEEIVQKLDEAQIDAAKIGEIKDALDEHSLKIKGNLEIVSSKVGARE